MHHWPNGGRTPLNEQLQLCGLWGLTRILHILTLLNVKQKPLLLHVLMFRLVFNFSRNAERTRFYFPSYGLANRHERTLSSKQRCSYYNNEHSLFIHYALSREFHSRCFVHICVCRHTITDTRLKCF